MALNNAVRAKVERPSRDQLPLIDKGLLPRTIGNNWDDPAWDDEQAKVQRLRGEETGRLVPNSLPPKACRDHLGPLGTATGTGRRTMRGLASLSGGSGSASSPAAAAVAGRAAGGAGADPGAGTFTGRLTRGKGFEDQDAPRVLSETAWRMKQATQDGIRRKAKPGGEYTIGRPGGRDTPPDGAGRHFYASGSFGASFGPGRSAGQGGSPGGNGQWQPGASQADGARGQFEFSVDPETGEEIVRCAPRDPDAAADGDAYQPGSGYFGDASGGKMTHEDLVSETAPALGSRDTPLRFLAYFVEEVLESQLERLRVRKVGLSFFHSDDTFAVFEPRIVNSGMRGGCLLKRQRVPLAMCDRKRRALTNDEERLPDLRGVPDKWASVKDLNVGQTVTLYGVEYHLYDCDKFTREFMTALGFRVPPRCRAPADGYMTDYRPRRIDGTKRAAGATDSDFDPAISPAALASQQEQRELVKAQRFAQDSGKVARFFGYWVDDEDGRVRGCELRHFIEDDTTGVSERRLPRAEPEGPPKAGPRLNPDDGLQLITLCSRRLLPKPQRVPPCANLSPFHGGANDPSKPHVTLRDLYVGAVIDVYGRAVHLYDADGWTRDFFRECFGVELAPVDDISAMVPPIPGRPQQPLPPGTGFGEKEPVNRSVVLKPARPAFRTQWSEYAGEQLRFRMRFHKPDMKEDAVRQFVLTFYWDDGEMMVSEIAGRNTGFSSGKFVKKQRLVRPECVQKPGAPYDVPEDRKYYGPEDLQIGAVLSITGFQFEVTEADARTEAIIARRDKERSDLELTKAGSPPPKPSLVPGQRLAELLVALRRFVFVRYRRATEAFRAFDWDHDRFVTLPELRSVLLENQMTSREDEAVAVLRTLGRGNDRVSFQDFVTFLSGDDRAPPPEDIDLTDAAARAAELNALTLAAGLRRRMVKLLKERLEGRYLNGFEMFRLLSTMPRAFKSPLSRGVEVAALTNVMKDTVVTPVQFRRGLQEVLGMGLTDADMAVLLRFFFPRLPAAQFGARIDDDLRHGLTVEAFQDKFVRMWSQDLIDALPLND